MTSMGEMKGTLGKSTMSRVTLGASVRAFCAFAILGFAVTVVTIRAVHAGSPADQPQPRVFGSDAGMVLNFIKPDKTADFEAVIGKLREALQKSAKPERKQQAAGWKVFKAREPGANGSVLYVFVIDPAAKGADYAVSSILAEAFPGEVQALYQQYAGAYASGQNFVNLTLVSALGQ